MPKKKRRSFPDPKVINPTSELGLSRAVEVVSLEDSDPGEKEVEIPVVEVEAIETDEVDIAWKMLEKDDQTKERKKPKSSNLRSKMKAGLNILKGTALGPRSRKSGSTEVTIEDIPLPPDPRPVFTRGIEVDRRFRRRWFDTKLGSEIASGVRWRKSREVEVKLMNYNVLADNLMKMHPELYRGTN